MEPMQKEFHPDTSSSISSSPSRPSRSNTDHPRQRFPFSAQDDQSRILDDPPFRRLHLISLYTPDNMRRNVHSTLSPLPPSLSETSPSAPNDGPFTHDSILGNLAPRTYFRVRTYVCIPIDSDQSVDCGRRMNLHPWEDGGKGTDRDSSRYADCFRRRRLIHRCRCERE